MVEDHLRKTFEDLRGLPMPATFGPADIVRRATAVRRRRRIAAVAGSGIGTTLVATVAAVLLLPATGSGVDPADPAPTVRPTSVAPPPSATPSPARTSVPPLPTSPGRPPWAPTVNAPSMEPPGPADPPSVSPLT